MNKKTKESLYASIIVTVILTLLFIFLFKIKELFKNNESFIAPFKSKTPKPDLEIENKLTLGYDTEVKTIINLILQKINSSYNYNLSLVDIDSVKMNHYTEINNNNKFSKTRYITRIYTYDHTLHGGMVLILTFNMNDNLGNDNNLVTIENIVMSNAIHLPNTVFTNINTNNTDKINKNMLVSEINKNNIIFSANINETEKLQKIKLNGTTINKISEYSHMYNPNNFNDSTIKVKNEYAVSPPGIDPYDNPTIKSQLSYNSEFSKLFSPGTFDRGDGKVIY